MAQYIYGNAVRKPIPAKEERPHLREVKIDKSYARSINDKKRLHFNAVYTLFMIAALFIVFVVCVNYLSLQSEVSEKSDRMASLEQTYNKLKSDNDYLEVYIDSNIDYDYILDVAINELGMVYANSSQVISYQSEDIEYVKQYSDIPQ